MFCTNCGSKQTSEALFCQFCGTKLPLASGESSPQSPRTEEPVYYQPPFPAPASSSGNGFGIVGLILATLGTVIALYDFGLVASGEFSYVAVEEVGLVFLISFAGTVFSGVGASKRSGAGVAGLILGLLGIFLSFLLSTISA
jgi:hypothetical protein